MLRRLANALKQMLFIPLQTWMSAPQLHARTEEPAQTVLEATAASAQVAGLENTATKVAGRYI